MIRAKKEFRMHTYIHTGHSYRTSYEYHACCLFPLRAPLRRSQHHSRRGFAKRRRRYDKRKQTPEFKVIKSRPAGWTRLRRKAPNSTTWYLVLIITTPDWTEMQGSFWLHNITPSVLNQFRPEWHALFGVRHKPRFGFIIGYKIKKQQL